MSCAGPPNASQTWRQLKAERARRLSLESNLGGRRVARTTAEIERDQATTRVVSEAESRWAAEKSAAEAAIVARERPLERAVEDFTRHSELGDWKEAGKAQRAIAEATAEKHAALTRVSWLESNKERIIPKAPTRTEVERPAARPSLSIHHHQRTGRWRGSLDRLPARGSSAIRPTAGRVRRLEQPVHVVSSVAPNRICARSSASWAKMSATGVTAAIATATKPGAEGAKWNDPRPWLSRRTEKSGW